MRKALCCEGKQRRAIQDGQETFSEAKYQCQELFSKEFVLGLVVLAMHFWQPGKEQKTEPSRAGLGYKMSLLKAETSLAFAFLSFSSFLFLPFCLPACFGLFFCLTFPTEYFLRFYFSSILDWNDQRVN